MPRLRYQPPKLSRIKSNNAAVVYVNGRTVYMGQWGSEKALQAYSRFLSEWTQSTSKEAVIPKRETTTAVLASAFLKSKKGIVDNSDFGNYRNALKTLRKLYPHLPIDEFGPKALALVREEFVKEGYSRGHCNKLTNFIRTVFRWGVAEELVSESTANALGYVQALREGKTEARETEPRQDVPDEVVERTKKYLFPTVAGMVDVQRLAVMRPNEICRMKVGDLDMVGEIWIYRPGKHKGTWRGHHKAVALGKPEQEIILPRLEGKGPENAVFSPRDTESERKARDAAKRKTPVQPSQRKRAEQRAKNPRSRVREHYDSQSYARSIKRSIEVANETLADPIPHWTPYQLRHAGVTEISKTDGPDVAQAVAGHRSPDMTRRYDHSQLEKAVEHAKKRKPKRKDA